MHLSFKCAVFCKQELKGEYQTRSLGQAQVASVSVCPIAFKARSAWKSVGSWGHGGQTPACFHAMGLSLALALQAQHNSHGGYSCL